MRQAAEGRRAFRWSKLWAVVAALLAVVLWLSLPLIWSPNLLLWVANASAMSDAGAWTGWDAVGADLSRWFVRLSGRTVATSILLAIQAWAIWRVFK